VADENTARERFLQIVESENLLNGRFSSPKRIDERGGNGCFSLLFIAQDERTGKRVALKFYDPTRQHDLSRVLRFEREAEILKILRDEPCVVNCVDGLCLLKREMVDSQSGISIPITLQFMALDLGDCNLEDVIYSGKTDPLSSLLYFKEALRGVCRVHARRICHRDFKPNNFLISGKKVWLSDFGTAKCMDGSMPDISSSYHLPIGDKRYVPPEVIFSFAIADEYTYSADIFSMGAILFEMFTHTLLTTQIYSPSYMQQFMYIGQVLSRMDPKKRLPAYKTMIKEAAKSIRLPDIYSFNEYVPGSIKLPLNRLYMDLAAINFADRIHDAMAIHRRLDICIKILRNENKYQIWLDRKKQRRLLFESRQ
jgi:serine/threonine protein kinase